MPKREPVILDNETGREINSSGAREEPRSHDPKPQRPRRDATRFRNFVEDELQYGMRDLAEDIVHEFGEAIREGVADAFSLDDVLMRRR